MCDGKDKTGFQQRFISWGVLIPVFLLLGTLTARGGGSLALTDDGQANAVIVLPADPHEDETTAADELRDHIARISGVELSILASDDAVPEGVTPIRLGGAADAALESAIREQGDGYSSFALFVDETGVNIRGLNPEGTLFGVYELLEQLGVRWFMPFELGTVIPEASTVRLDHQQTVQMPSMDWRQLQWLGIRSYPTWARRNRLGGERRATGRHGMPGDPPRGTGRQACLSGHYAEGALEAVVEAIRERYEPREEKFYISMGPEDGGGYCECEGCMALDSEGFDPHHGAGTPIMSDRYVWFFNRVLEELEDDYPDLHIAWYVYGATMWPPEKYEPNPRIVHVFAPINLDRTRGMDNPMSPDRHLLRHAVDGWAEFEPNEMAYRGYFNNLACSQFPFSQIDRIKNEIPVMYEKGIRVNRVEVIKQSWASTPLTPYLAARVWWDVNADVDALLADFYEKFFGPAEGPMRSYFEDLEAAFRDTPYHTGSSYLYFPIFDAHRRDTLRGHLERAAEKKNGARRGWFARLRETVGGRRDDPTPDDETECIYSERVRMIADAFQRLELFLDLMEARNRHDFRASNEILEKYLELTDAMIEKEWILESRRRRRGGGPYFDRFFMSALESGYRRTVTEGDLVMGLPDTWDFLIDPAGIGEIAGYQRDGKIGGNWQPLKTTSRSWSDQGLHYYINNYAWYRTQVMIPKAFEGRDIYLWFGGVDTFARVWVNGELMGTNREPKRGLPGEAGTFRPFEFLATDAVRFGEENTVAVKVKKTRLAELGTGGIISPVMFWSPHDEDWTP